MPIKRKKRAKAPVMVIRNKQEWQDVLVQGAVVLHETKLCKIFQMPDGNIWRVLPKYRLAWLVEVE